MSVATKQDIRGWKALKPMLQVGRLYHGCCQIDDHRMIIVGGVDAVAGDKLASGMIYDARTELWMPLPNDMPQPLLHFGIAGNEKYVFVIGGKTARRLYINTVYQLSLETYEWTTMAPMATARRGLAAVRKGHYIYVFGGYSGRNLRLVERYSIASNTWEPLPDMKTKRCDHCAVVGSGSDIYIVGGADIDDSVEMFDTVSLLWNTAGTPHKIQGKKHVVAVLLKDQYLVMIGGLNDDCGITAGYVSFIIFCLSIGL